MNRIFPVRGRRRCPPVHTIEDLANQTPGVHLIVVLARNNSEAHSETPGTPGIRPSTRPDRGVIVLNRLSAVVRRDYFRHVYDCNRAAKGFVR
jgi:hypothetical protein